MIVMQMSPYLGNEKNNGDYSSQGSLPILGKPYDVQHDRSSEQRDKLKPISISCDPRERRAYSPIATTVGHQEAPALRFQTGR